VSTVIYEFIANHATELWSTDPAKMVDGTETSYASTTTDGDIQCLITNECDGADLGTISKVELRFYGYADDNDQCILRPVFGGTLDGDNHVVVPGVTAGWKAWQDITSDPNSPGEPSYEYYKAGDNSYLGAYGATWEAQTFTPSTGHNIGYVKLKAYRYDSPGTVTVGIRATDVGGEPTGDDLTSGTFDGDAITDVSPGEWVTVTLTPYSLSGSTKYAIVVRAPNGDVWNYINWRVNTAGEYAGGNATTSVDSGDNWQARAAYDLMFEEGVTPPEWSWPDIQSLDCDVEQNDVSKGNTMHVGMVQIQVTYTEEAAAEWKQLQYTSEPPTPNAWNQLKQEAGTGFVKLLFEGE